MAPVDHTGEAATPPVALKRFVADAERIEIVKRIPGPDNIAGVALELDNHVADDFLFLAGSVLVVLVGVVVVDLAPLGS